ncbi:hypothetical protein BDC45DRAFT_594673 [Circinella umbellata]|nr:hypothetical protein BDC45DRAFT_594673 [Circinella umbellata]
MCYNSAGELHGRERICNATWRDMGVYCRYCHSQAHVIKNCPTKPVPKCFNCGALGHIAGVCSKPKTHQPNNRRLFKRKRTKTQSQTDSSGDKLPPKNDSSFDIKPTLFQDLGKNKGPLQIKIPNFNIGRTQVSEHPSVSNTKGSHRDTMTTSADSRVPETPNHVSPTVNARDTTTNNKNDNLSSTSGSDGMDFATSGTRNTSSEPSSAVTNSQASKHNLQNQESGTTITSPAALQEDVNTGSSNKPDRMEDLFIRHIKNQGMNLLALQDTYIQDFDSTDILEKHFGATSSIWSKYCGLVNFSQFIYLDPLFITRDGRGMWIRVTHVHNTFTPFNIFNIYAPANPHDRFAFFNQQILPIVNQPTIKDQLDETFIMGDFNYSYSSNDSSFRSAPKAQNTYLPPDLRVRVLLFPLQNY